MAKKRKTKRSIPPKKIKYIPPAIEKAKASTLSKVLFVITILLFMGIISYYAIKTGNYPTARVYPGQPY